MSASPSRFIILSAHKSIAENRIKFTEFLADFVVHSSPTTLRKNDIPDEMLRRHPVISYVTMNASAAAGEVYSSFCPKETFLEQADAIYEASVDINPFLNTIVVPAIDFGAAPTSKNNQQENVDQEGKEITKSKLTIAIQDTSAAVVVRPITTHDLLKVSSAEYPVHGYVALGGTFDRLHPGHKMLLTQAALATGTRLRVGITGPKLLVNKKNADMLQSFEVRCAAATEFLRTLRPDLELEVVELEEKSGGTNAIAAVDAMVVSPETLPSLESINAERREKGFKDMKAVVIEFFGGETNETRISSSKLRAIEIEAKKKNSPREE